MIESGPHYYCEKIRKLREEGRPFVQKTANSNLGTKLGRYTVNLHKAVSSVFQWGQSSCFPSDLIPPTLLKERDLCLSCNPDTILIYHSHESGKKLNCRANFKKGTRKNQSITCVDWSTAFLKKTISTKKGKGQASINSIEKVENHPAFVDDEWYTLRQSKKTRKAIYFDLSHFTDALIHVCSTTFRQAEGKKRHEASYFFLSNNHAMAMRLIIKDDLVIILFYDPNDTTRHKRIVCRIENIPHLSIHDFLPQKLIDLYFDDKNQSAVFELADWTDKASERETVLIGDPMGLFIALYDGVLEQVEWKRRAKSILTDTTLPNQIKHEILSSKDATGLPGLSAAMLDSHPGSIKEFCKLILNSSFSEEEKVKLLLSLTSDGHPGLYCAFAHGCPTSIHTYCHIILGCSLPLPLKVRLLSAENLEGTAGLNAAFSHNQPDAIKVFFDLIHQSNLPVEHKFGLLTASDSNGVPGLHRAMKKGHHKTVSVFCDAVLASSLPLPQKMALLAARGTKNKTALQAALDRGQSKTTNVFCQKVLASSLPEQCKLDLLNARDQQGYAPGLHKALEQGCAFV